MLYAGSRGGNDRVGRDEIDGASFRCNFPEVTNELTHDSSANWIALLLYAWKQIKGVKTK